MRDRYGITQVTIDPSDVSVELATIAESLKNEFVIKVHWSVVARPDNMVNKDMKTWDIEIHATSVEILSKSKELPFNMWEDPKTSEENRFMYRYLDIRRKPVLDNIMFRAQMNHFTRNRFTKEWFLEVQTPIFTVSSPEWARDYLIPSRVNQGQFYALPQAPQQYKQLLMVGWVDKYFQIAPCFRDEDPRADRHSCEVYQIDCEMSFVEKEDVYTVAEWYIRDMTSQMVPHKTIQIDFVRLSYADAMDTYGSDKPDLRFDCKMIDVKDIFGSSELDFLRTAVSVKAIKLWSHPTRKELDALTKFVQNIGLGWLAYIQIKEDTISGSIANKMSQQEKDLIVESMWGAVWDTIFLLVWDQKTVVSVWAKFRNHLRDTFDLVDKDALGFVWIEDFPFFEEDETKPSGLEFAHNPFSNIKWGHETVDTLPPLERETTQYDLTCNWYEILSGSIRNHNPDVLLKAFEAAGYELQDIKKRFWTMYEALQYWCPPHGWFAFGFDRLMMILRDEPNIRECYAFPKSGRAQDLMMWAPSNVDPKELDILGLEMKKKEE